MHHVLPRLAKSYLRSISPAREAVRKEPQNGFGAHEGHVTVANLANQLTLGLTCPYAIRIHVMSHEDAAVAHEQLMGL